FSFKNLPFKNRIGLAAGFDKNARYYSLMQQLGFGFLEIGSVTANESKGNSKPRLFRLPQDEALINRMGLNNDGVTKIVNRLEEAKREIPFGVNIAKTHSPLIMGEYAILDYVESFAASQFTADYITINISCPNTEEGKTFEDPETLNHLLGQINLVRKTDKPLLVKFSSDSDEILLKELTDICLNHGIDGFVCSNTSSKRSNLKTEIQELTRIGKGGLSGKPIKSASIKNVERIRSFAPNSLLIGVGGIASGEDGVDYLKAGADLIQVYSGLVYEGPSLVKNIQEKFIEYYK
ncbi:MAG: quinone-dependent dihydroorotate dehydrogenase, partial [Bacteroidetes bacterium]|nr:quinone-dependent dihydroorotate dehydrogenase [Bacteroidota bacterium]